MPKSTAICTDILELLLNATPITSLALNATATPAATLYVALHTADPGAGGTQATNEVAYTGYARASVARNPTTKAWTITNGSAKPVSPITFPKNTGTTTVTPTHASIGLASTGTSKFLYSGAITNRAIAPGDSLIVEAISEIKET